jgi:hypothetical protein
MLQLQYVYPCIAYRKNTVLLVTAFFGIPFITIGSEAYNAMSIGIRATSAARPELASPEGLIRGIALSASVFTMLVHTLSRKGGCSSSTSWPSSKSAFYFPSLPLQFHTPQAPLAQVHRTSQRFRRTTFWFSALAQT